MSQQPSVGRIVHYQDYSTDKPLAAIITGLDEPPYNDQDRVSLAVFGLKDTKRHSSVPRSYTPREGYWNWPPR